MVPLFRVSRLLVPPAQPPQDQKEWNKRECEKERTTAAMDETVNHLRTYVHAEKGDYQNPESVPQNTEWDYECDEGKTPPRRFQKQIRGKDAGNEENPARTNAAAFLRNFDGDVWQLKNGA